MSMETPGCGQSRHLRDAQAAQEETPQKGGLVDASITDLTSRTRRLGHGVHTQGKKVTQLSGFSRVTPSASDTVSLVELF